jgi:hypothetical protein
MKEKSATEVKKDPVPHVWGRAGIRADGSVRQKCRACGTFITQPEAAQCCEAVQKWQRRFYPTRRT